ncbi:MAG: outer membrane lipid asymmetry maintenance protein MlaD [Myxococcales bacterium]|nr:outer membrane lipid asymmetry maintenance protein MlaD [Myxococcales bacterium]MDH5307931.1 outer membrane lipid asymmetry maintenance protein MlaD [Myxococcales bacterium]MDH5565093.1 outer membrane lipid asymmetry maintenance protein MlaD [Myxococcales bacterium]
MQASPKRDLTVGLFVMLGLAAIGYLSIQVGGVTYSGPGGLTIYATFDEVGGLKPRAPVAVAGVSVGQVKRIELDSDLRARVTLDLDPNLELSADTSASIRTSGLLGDQFVALEPGSEDEILRPGEEIAYTESALLLERLIGRFVHDSGVRTD